MFKRINPFLVAALCLGIYLVKSMIGIDILKDYSFSQWLPFRLNLVDHSYAAQKDFEFNEEFLSKAAVEKEFNLWMRDTDAVTYEVQKSCEKQNGCLLIENQGREDWAFELNKFVHVVQGDVFEYSFSGKIKDGAAQASFGVVLFDSEKKVLDWHYLRQELNADKEWQSFEGKFIVPAKTAMIKFRVTGKDTGKVWFDRMNIKFERNLQEDRKELLPDYSLSNKLVKYTLDWKKEIIQVIDQRNQKLWQDKDSLQRVFVRKIEKINQDSLKVMFVSYRNFQEGTAIITIKPDSPEISYEILMPEDRVFEYLNFPQLFDFNASVELVVPMQEGMLIDKTFPFKDFPKSLYYSRQWSMPFIGGTDGNAGWMAIVETPYDFRIVKAKDKEGNLVLENQWVAEKERFSYPRKMKYVFVDQGGYVKMAKIYRAYARQQGKLKTLRSKAQDNANITKLIGAVNLWYWGKGHIKLARELQKRNVPKVFFSNIKWNLEEVNNFNYLTSKYDIYQDVWPPDLSGVAPRTQGWPEDLVVDVKQKPIKGWTIKRKGQEYPGGVICSIKGLDMARKRIAEDLKNYPYTGRFIDTVTASPWRECYHPQHPTTKREDAEYKMDLLNVVSYEMGLITGSEDGVDAAVPYADYFEGMMSIIIGRLPDSGRGVRQVKYVAPTEDFLKYQIGYQYRIPLWELVYHDCIVSTWYWGDSSNKIPEYLNRRNLFNILYGNMPMWTLRDWKHWTEQKDVLIESYYHVGPVFEKVGFEEMVAHEFVTPDRSVQRSQFSNDVNVYVNFSEQKFELGEELGKVPAHGYVIFDKNKVWQEGELN